MMTNIAIRSVKQQHDRVVAAAEAECHRAMKHLQIDYDRAMTDEIRRYDCHKDASEPIGMTAAKRCDHAMKEIRREFRHVAGPIWSRYDRAKTSAKAEYDRSIAEIREQERRDRIAAAAARRKE